MKTSEERPSNPPGWYFDASRTYRWWDGANWGPAAPATVPTDPVESGRTLALISHLGAIAGGFPLPLVIRLTEGKKNEFVRHHSTEALNFQITFMGAWFAMFALFAAALIADAGEGFLFLFFFAGFPLMTLNYVFSILGAVRASQKEWWRYPISIRFVPGAIDAHHPQDART